VVPMFWSSWGILISLARPRCIAKIVHFLAIPIHRVLALALSSKHGAALMLSSAVSVPPLKRTVDCLRRTLLVHALWDCT
jgi:hypothetical protein